MTFYRYIAMLPALAIGVGCLVVGCHSGASCGDACSHYLTCDGYDSSYQSQCESICSSAAPTSDWLNQYVATDCATAVAIIDGTSSSSGSNGSSGGWGASSSGSSGSSGGCYPDGHSCSAGGDCCNGNCIDQSVNDWICY